VGPAGGGTCAGPGVAHLNSVQLRLALFMGQPWDGRSPRGLTKVALGLILKPRGVRRESIFADPLQIDMFARKRAPRLRLGAPSASTLLPLPKRGT